MGTGVNVSIPGVTLEIIFGIVAVFLFFAPIVLGWDYWAYVGCAIFIALALITVWIKRRS